MGLSSLNPTGQGGFIDPKQFVPITRTINKKPLSADIELSLADFESKPGQSLEQYITALEQKITELELAIESGTTPEDLSPILESVKQAKQAADAAKKVADKAASDLLETNKAIANLTKKLTELSTPETLDVFPFMAGWRPYNGVGFCDITKIGGVVHLTVRASGDESSSNVFLQLPVGWRPKGYIKTLAIVPDSVNGGDREVDISLDDTSGQVSIAANEAYKRIAFTISYVAG